MALDTGDLDRLIASHRRPDCWVCGTNDWRVFAKAIDANPTRLVLGTSWPDGTPVEDFGLSVFAHACNNCGHIRLTAADPVITLGEEPDSEDETDPQD